jgi:branched-chain amino acid transport system ATP-binding protein
VGTTPGGTQADFKRLLEQQYARFPILSEFRNRAAGRLSGGQRQMLAVSRALMARPRTLILDEPSAGLSPKVTEELFLGLAAIKRERSASIILAEQNVSVAAQVADWCIVLEDGKVALRGSIDGVMKNERLRTAYLGL